MGETRETVFRVRMSAEERAMLEGLAAARGLTASDVVRQLVREAARAAKGAGR